MEKRRLREDLVVFNDLKEIRAQSQDPFLQQKGERQQPQAAAWEIPGRYMEGKKKSPFACSSTGTGCPEGFGDLHPWRCSELD